MCTRSSSTTLACLMVMALATVCSAQPIPNPEQFFGFRLGSDYKLASWEQIVSYFKELDQASDKLTLQELGHSTMGNPFVMAIISSPANLARLDELKANSRRIAKARDLSDQQARRIASESPIVVLITCSIHATEVGATQASPELAYNLITQDTPATQRVLNNVLFLLVPSFNPDGLVLVKEWYDKYVETPYEGSGMPWLYHKYTGHDNNRDAYMLTQVESQLVTKVMYQEWFPQVYLDMHQMGSSGPRIFVPPYQEPLNPNPDPLVNWENALLGEHMAMDLQAKGYRGVGTRLYFTAWWQGAFLQTAWWHNMVGLLTELASCRIASPIFLEKGDLKGGGLGFERYQVATNFPDPWPGGWWRLRDIVDYDLAAAFSLLEAAAQLKEKFLYNHYLMGKRAIAKGQTEPPYAFLIPPEQHDRGAATKLLDVLQQGGVELHRAQADFVADGVPYPAGTHVVLMAQPYRAFAKDLLEPQRYPDMRQYPDGPPIPPYDAAGWTLPLQMGVTCVQVERPFTAQLVAVAKVQPEPGSLSGGGYAYALSPSENASYAALNCLLAEGLPAYAAAELFSAGGQSFPAGTVLVPTNKVPPDRMRKIAQEKGLHVKGVRSKPRVKAYRLSPRRIAVYQPWTSSMHEGWSRWVLEQYGFAYTNLHNEEIRAGRLRERYDVIYFPDIYAEGILEGRPEGTAPPEFTKGIEAKGLANLRQFVEQGGAVIAIDSAGELFINQFGLPVTNVLKELKQQDFFCPGSILTAEYNTAHPVAFGMEPQGVAYFSRSAAYKLIPSFNVQAQVIAKYPAKNLLKSGWLLGEEHLAERVAAVEVPAGQGRVVLIGFDPINRAQAHATFKLLFNALLYAATEPGELP
ncbi:MAG: M14 family zinc carboxypeptidase [Candidatus Oleimicrobiaceae bacterium]